MRRSLSRAGYLASVRRPISDGQHPSLARYRKGCRCEPCVVLNRERSRERARAMRQRLRDG